MSSIRPVIFWSHLVVGVFAGIVIMIMSATGVLLTYERQIAELVERSYKVAIPASGVPLPVDDLLGVVRDLHPEEHHFYLRVGNREGAAVPVWAGPHSYLLDPLNGDILREGIGAVGEFMDFVTDLHRWLAVGGEGQGIARAINNYSNLLFLFLIATGIYLWLPRVWRWPILRMKILFNPRATNAKARDFNWHHVFSFWSLIPLFVVVASATVIYFPWATALIYFANGEDLPEPEAHEELTVLEDGDRSFDDLMAIAIMHASENGAADWHSIWMEAGEEAGKVRFYIDRSLGNRPAFAYSLYLDHDDGSVLEVKRHEDWTRADRAWDFARFAHTGEVFGFVGQTIAGLASLAACLLVYTGLALAWRRLVSPLLK